MKITKQQLKQIIREELHKLHEGDEDSWPGVTTGPWRQQPNREPTTSSTDPFFGIFKVTGGYETVVVVGDSKGAIEEEFEKWSPGGGDKIEAIIQGKLVYGKVGGPVDTN